MTEHYTPKGWRMWLEDHYWEHHKQGKRVLYIDPVIGTKHQLGKAISIQRERKPIFFLPPIHAIEYSDRNFTYTTYSEECEDCKAKGCVECFKSGYVFRYTETPKK